ncbi:MAG: tetratricopeptide repeat protein [Candidatus Latescibacterota bacterium]|nr:MAG: tetratricopeptide repeat protein [Candidatus Latescibacterota bacterium]
MSSPSGVIALVFIIGLLVRITYVIAFRESPFFDIPIVDAQWHDNWAKGWAEGTFSQSGRAFFRAPLYPFWLSLVYRVFGHDLMIVRIIQAVLGAGAAAALAGCGWRVAGRRGALWAGGIAAFYGPFVYFDAELLIPNLLIVLLAWALYFFLARPSRRSYLTGALFIGLAIIARPTALVVLPAVVVYLWKHLGDNAVLRKQLAVTVTLVALLPAMVVTAANVALENTFVFVASQGGVNFYAGNHAEATGRSVNIPEFANVQNSWADFVSASFAYPEQEMGRRVSSREAQNFWTRRAWNWIASDPAAALKLTVKKAYYLVNAYEMPNNRDLYLTRPFPLKLIQWKKPFFEFNWGLHLPHPVMGAVTGLRTRGTRRTTMLLAGWVVLYAAFLVPFFLSARFRLGLVPALILLATIALIKWRRLWTKGPVIAGLAALVLTNTGFLDARTENLGQEYAKRGQAAFQLGKLDQARRDFEAAVEISPNTNKYTFFLGELYLAEGNKDQAYTYFKQTLDLGATNHRILESIGRAFISMGKYPEAVVALERVVEQRPNDAARWRDLGRAAEMSGQADRAIEAYRRAVTLEPDNDAGYLGLGFAYQKKDEADLAINAWETGVKNAPRSYALQYNLALAYAQLERYELSRQMVDMALITKPNAEEALALRQWLDKEMSKNE